MLARALCLMALLIGFGFGCGGDDDDDGSSMVPNGRPDAGGGARRCVDNDDDGFGDFCDDGDDCDDDDPEVTDECRRCRVPNEGCPCEAGTKPLHCDPKDLRTTNDKGQTGVLVCSEGTRYCRKENPEAEKSEWSDCEILFQYATFVAD